MKKKIITVFRKVFLDINESSYVSILMRASLCILIWLAVFVFPRPFRDFGFVTALIDICYSLIFLPVIPLLILYLLSLTEVRKRKSKVKVDFTIEQVMGWFTDKPQVDCYIISNNDLISLSKRTSHHDLYDENGKLKKFKKHMDYADYTPDSVTFIVQDPDNDPVNEMFFGIHELENYLQVYYCNSNNMLTVTYLELDPPILNKHRRKTDLVALKKYYEALENNPDMSEEEEKELIAELNKRQKNKKPDMTWEATKPGYDPFNIK